MISLDRQSILTLLQSLVQAPSFPGLPRQEEVTAAALASFFRTQGIPVTMQEIRPGRPNLLASLRGERPGRHLLFCGHTDTVAPNQLTTMNPFAAEIRDGRMYGRGTVDMKGALAAMAGAMAALKQMRAVRCGGVSLAAVIDEEMESLGAEALIHSGVAADGAIVGEPTQNLVAIGHKGLEWLEAGFSGKATHGGTAEQGVNAINAAATFIGLIQEQLQPRLVERRHPMLGAPSLNIGTIRGGDQPSTVAAQCIVQIDRRWIPSESVESVLDELQHLLALVRQRMPGLQTALRRVPGGMATMIHGPVEIAPDHPLVSAAQAARREVYGQSGPLVAFPAWTDASLLSREGKIPCIVCGPGDLSLAHSAEESIRLAEVLEAAEIYAMTAQNFLSPA